MHQIGTVLGMIKRLYLERLYLVTVTHRATLDPEVQSLSFALEARWSGFAAERPLKPVKWVPHRRAEHVTPGSLEKGHDRTHSSSGQQIRRRAQTNKALRST